MKKAPGTAIVPNTAGISTRYETRNKPQNTFYSTNPSRHEGTGNKYRHSEF